MGVLLKCHKILSEYKHDALYKFIEKCSTGLNFKKKDLINDFLKTKKAKNYRKEFCEYGRTFAVRLKYPKENDSVARQGDVIVLKPYISSKEKGVILISYNDSFEKFISVYHADIISKKYRIVLEPSTWGYQDVVLWLFRSMDTEIIIQAQDEKDYNYIASLGGNFKAIRMGAGDWIDPENFCCSKEDKLYDVIMVASWQLIKRHRELFKALSKIKNHVGKVCLVGYPCEGRCKEDIIKEANHHGVLSMLDIFENITQDQVANKLCSSKVSVMLTKREGASKIIYESLSCNVPVLITSENRGVNRKVINSYTGIFSDDKNIPYNLIKMIRDYDAFSPRSWLLEYSGYARSTMILNDFIRELALTSGEQWTQDIYTKKNASNPIYVYENEWKEAESEFCKLADFLAC